MQSHHLGIIALVLGFQRGLVGSSVAVFLCFVFVYPISSFLTKTSTNRVKLIIEEIEREEAALRQELYSVDRKFAEYYNVYDRTFILFYPSFQRLIAWNV